MKLESILILGIAIGMVIDIALAIAAFALIRLYFGRYVRREHPEVWEGLFRAEAVDLIQAMDSMRLREFDVCE